MPNPITLKSWTDNLSKVLPQKLDDRGLPEDSSADAGQGGWKLLGLKMSAFTELEVAFIKKHKAFPTCSKTGARLLFPTLEAMRLTSVLTTSRSTRTETAEPTRLQRTKIFLMMGGFLITNLRKSGIASLHVQTNSEVSDDLVQSIALELEMSAMHTDIVQLVRSFHPAHVFLT